MSNRINLVSSGQLQAKVTALTQENTALRQQLILYQEQCDTEPVADDPATMSVAEICRRIDYLNFRRDACIAKCKVYEKRENQEAFKDECKYALLCNLIELEQWKIKLIEQELACYTYMLHQAKNENYEDKIVEKCNLLESQIEECKDTTNPYVQDVIRNIDL